MNVALPDVHNYASLLVFNVVCTMYSFPLYYILQFRKKAREIMRKVIIYLTYECTNRCLSLITNAEANIRINESSL